MSIACFSYAQYVEMALIHIDFLTYSEQEMILSGNARRVYNI